MTKPKAEKSAAPCEDCGALQGDYCAPDCQQEGCKRMPVVREVDGHLVLDDPVALAVIRGVSKHNCEKTYEMNEDRVEHFCGRIKEKGLTANDVVIVILNVDDQHGGPMADRLMPGFNWQEIRDRGEIPFARGLAVREGIQEVLGHFDTEAAEKLSNLNGVAVVVVDHDVAEIFDAEAYL